MTAASMIILILFYNVYGMKRQKRFKNCQFLCDSWGILEKSTSSVSCTLIQFCNIDSIDSIDSIGSICSIGSIGSKGSIGSIGSIGNISSIGSIDSIGSIGSNW
jgi:hypothetical protein